MAASSSQGSSAASSQHDVNSQSLPVETLVNHLLASKRSLSSMTLVLRANELSTTARQSYEDASILTAQADFLRSSILDQADILVKVRRGLQATYDWGQRDFRKIIKVMDQADRELAETMQMLRNTSVESVFRQKGEGRQNLLDFVDEIGVDGIREVMKQSIQAMQNIQQSYDGDLLRFDTDIRNLKRAIQDSTLLSSHDGSAPNMPSIIESLIDHSGSMALLLTSLTHHFDMCVTAIRTTEGGVALALRRVAEVTQSQGGGNDGVSISGIIAEQEGHMSDLEPKTPADRAEMLRVVIQDAQEVEDVVREISDTLKRMEQEHAVLEQQTGEARTAYTGVLKAYVILGEIEDRLGDYLVAEQDFKTRWDMERDAVENKVTEMRELRKFYDGYASAYDSLILEVERRRTIEDRVKSIWRKAQENVDKLLDADRDAREAFRQDVGEYLPTDLWAGMQGPARRWTVVPVREDGEMDESTHGEQSMALRRSVVEAARQRLEKSASESK